MQVHQRRCCVARRTRRRARMNKSPALFFSFSCTKTRTQHNIQLVPLLPPSLSMCITEFPIRIFQEILHILQIRSMVPRDTFFVVMIVMASLNSATRDALVGAELFVEKGAAGCVFDPSPVNQQPAFGLYRTLRDMCPSLSFPVAKKDPLVMGAETPEISVILGPNGTVVDKNADDVTFHGIGGSQADVTASLEANEGWSIVMFVKLSNLSDGALTALADNSTESSAELLTPVICSGTNCSNSTQFYGAVMVTGSASLIHIYSPSIQGRNGRRAVSFVAPSLFDGAWHLLGVVFETLAASHYARVTLHIDGADPFAAKLEYCSKAQSPPSRLPLLSTAWNTTAGALSVGGAAGSYHAVLWYRSVLSRQTIAALGTAAIRRTAAGGDKNDLFAAGFIFIIAALALAVWGGLHALQEAQVLGPLVMSSVTTTDDEAQVAVPTDNEAHPFHNNRLEQQAQGDANVVKLASNATALGVGQSAQVVGAAKAAVSSMKSAAVPVASAAAVVSVASLGLQVPQQMTVLFSYLTFPRVFRSVFGNFFDMVAIRFDFPEVSIPPYAPLIVVLVGMTAAVCAVVWWGLRDRRMFALAVEQWRDRVAAYGILLRYIVDDVIAECGSPVPDEGAKRMIVDRLVAEFPTPAGCFTAEYFDHLVCTILVEESDTTKRVARRLWSRCRYLLDVMPADTVTTLCMCLIPQTKSRVVLLADIVAMAKKLQVLAKSFDRTFEASSKACEMLGIAADDTFVRKLAEAWSAAPTTSTFTAMLERIGAASPARPLEELQAEARATLAHQEDEALEREDVTVEDVDNEAKGAKHDDANECPETDEAANTFSVEKGESMLREQEKVEELRQEEETTRRKKHSQVESAFLWHVNLFIRSVLTWVVEPDSDHLVAFAQPFFEFNRIRRSEAAEEDPSLAVDGFLQSSRQAAALYSIMYRDAAAVATDDKAPPYNRETPTRQYLWLDATASPQCALPVTVAEVTTRMLNLKSNNEGTQPSKTTASKSQPEKTIIAANMLRCCPEHTMTVVVKATETHLESQTLDGRPSYRCCNMGMDAVKQALHGAEHTAGDECDDGEVFICPVRTCGFTVCGRCLRREIRPSEMWRVRAATIAHKLRHLNPPLTATLAIVLLDALLFPVTQIPLLVLTCSPTLSCWLRDCYIDWSPEFVASFTLSIVLLCIRCAVGVWLWLELRRRQRLTDAVLFSSSNSDIDKEKVPVPTSVSQAEAALSVRNARWEYFVLHCDHSLLRSMYVGTELTYIAWSPAVKLVFDIILVLAVCLSPADSVAQQCAVGVVYVVRGIMLSMTNPNLQLSLDILSKAVIVHQLLVVGLSSVHRGLTIDSVEGNGASNVVMAFMLVVTFAFILLAASVVINVVVAPFVKALWIDAMSELVRRDAQAAKLPHDFLSLKKKQSILEDTLLRKQRLCASFGTLVKHRWRVASFPFPQRGGSQLAITAALICQALSLEREQEGALSSQMEQLNARSVSILKAWLEAVTLSGAFHDFDLTHFSLCKRQLQRYESNALGEFIEKHLVQPTQCATSDDDSKLLVKQATALKSVARSSDVNDLNGEVGEMSACNQLQILSAADLTEGLDFRGCDVRGCRLVTGTRVCCSRFGDCDLGSAVLPDCTFVACDIQRTSISAKSFAQTTRALTVSGHLKGATSVAISRNGLAIASGSGGNSVHIWDATSGREQWRLVGHTGAVTAVVFSPDGCMLASSSADKTIRLWDTVCGGPRSVLSGHSGAVSCVAYSPDGLTIASGSNDRSMRLWDAASGRQVWINSAHSGPVNAVSFSPNGKLVATGGDDRVVRVVDIATSTEVLFLQQHYDIVLGVAFSPDGLMIASASRDTSVRLWDAVSGAELRVLTGHTDAVATVAFSPDSTHIVSGSADATVRVWDAASGAELRVLTGHNRLVKCAVFSFDGLRIVSSSEDCSFRVWDGVIEAEPRFSSGHTEFVTSVTISPDGALLVSGSADMTIRLWDSTSGREKAVLKGHSDVIFGVAFSPDGLHLASGSRDRTVRVWRVTPSTLSTAVPGACIVFNGHTEPVTGVAFSPDGEHIASCSDDKTIRVWSVSAPEEEARLLSGHEDYVRSIAYSADGMLLVSGGDDSTARLWDMATGTEIKALVHSDYVRAVAFSPTAEHIATGSDDRIVRLWDTASGVELRALEGHSGYVRTLSYSPNGLLIVSGSGDHTLRVWDAATGESLSEFTHSHVVNSCAFASDGLRVVSGSSDSTVRVWNLRKPRDEVGNANEYMSASFKLDMDRQIFLRAPSLLLCVGGHDFPLQNVCHDIYTSTSGDT